MGKIRRVRGNRRSVRVRGVRRGRLRGISGCENCGERRHVLCRVLREGRKKLLEECVCVLYCVVRVRGSYLRGGVLLRSADLWSLHRSTPACAVHTRRAGGGRGANKPLQPGAQAHAREGVKGSRLNVLLRQQARAAKMLCGYRQSADGAAQRA